MGTPCQPTCSGSKTHSALCRLVKVDRYCLESINVARARYSLDWAPKCSPDKRGAEDVRVLSDVRAAVQAIGQGVERSALRNQDERAHAAGGLGRARHAMQQERQHVAQQDPALLPCADKNTRNRSMSGMTMLSRESTSIWQEQQI